MTIFDYLEWRGDLDFSSSSFNDTDNMILTQVIYVDLTGIVESEICGPCISIKDAACKYKELHPEHEHQPEQTRMSVDMLYAMAETERFKNCMLHGYEREYSSDPVTQFSAVCIDIPGGETYIAFSGTDTSLVGWKENCDLCYLPVTRGQEKALIYLTEAARRLPGQIMTGGHSKGGNLAVYAAMYISEALQQKLTAIYNNDGPGFTPKMFFEKGYRAIEDRIHTILPEGSVVGMLLDHTDRYTVVRTNAGGIRRHYVFTWQVLGNHSVTAPSVGKESLLIEQAVRAWLEEMDDDARRHFTESLFSVLENAGVEDFFEIDLPRIAEIIHAAEDMEHDDKSFLIGRIRALAAHFGKAGLDRLSHIEAPETLERIKTNFLNRKEEFTENVRKRREHKHKKDSDEQAAEEDITDILEELSDSDDRSDLQTQLPDAIIESEACK